MSKHVLRITFTQETDGKNDNETLVQEFSDDTVIQLMKTKIFSEELTKATNNITQRLCDLGIDALGGGKSNR